MTEKENAREIATMLYGEVPPGGHFRFVNFGHPPPLVFSAELSKLVNIDEARVVQFLALGLQLPADHPDRRKYYSMNLLAYARLGNRIRDSTSTDQRLLRMISARSAGEL